MLLVERQAATEPNEVTLQLLIHTMNMQRAEGRGVTFIIGAGCSLSSASNDISTTGIIHSIVEEIQQKKIQSNASSVDVYRTFVNYWSRFGDEQVVKLLTQRLSCLTPSLGYRYLRNLAAQGYVKHIITTNFDLLIDDVLNDVPHMVLYGNGEREQRGNSLPLLTLIKVHGDIRKGRPIFTPFEIVNLPELITASIKEASHEPTIVCGYRGQDIGLMRALDNTSSFNAFWVNPEIPDWTDTYTYSLVHEWLRSRRSEANCLYGMKYGSFDEFMSLIVTSLEAATHLGSHHKDAPLLPELWANSPFGRILDVNSKVKRMFSDILSTIDLVTEHLQWQPRPPHYSETRETHLAALLQPLSSGFTPSSLLSVLDNEFDALLVGVTLAIQAQAVGTNISSKRILWDVRNMYAGSNCSYQADDNFWLVLEILLERANGLDSPPEVRLHLNSQDRLKLVVTPAPVKDLVALLTFLDAVALTFPTARPVDNPPPSLRARLLLQGQIEKIETIAGRTCLFLREMSPPEFSSIFDLLGTLCSDVKLLAQGHFKAPWFDVQAEISEPVALINQPPVSENLYSTLVQESTASLKIFNQLLSVFDTLASKALRLRSEEHIAGFLKSKTTGIFVIGPSGSGKTTCIRNTFSSHVSESLIPIVITQTHRNRSLSGLQTFLPGVLAGMESSGPSSVITAISEALEARGSTLVLVLDGLNENIPSAESLRQDYRDLVNLAEILGKHGKGKIKLIVTCRDATFISLLASEGMPSAEHFYWGDDANSLPQPYYAVPELDQEERNKLIDIYFDRDIGKSFDLVLRSNRILARDFARPYIIAASGAILKSKQDLDGLRSVNQIFARFSNQMLRRLGDESLLVIVNEIIRSFFLLYFSGDRGPLPVPRLQLLATFQVNERPRVASILRGMEDVSLIKHQAVASPGHIEFSHDRITEYFLGDFLMRESNDGSFFQRSARWAEIDPVCNGGVREYFSRVWSYVESQRSTSRGLLDTLAVNISRILLQPSKPIACNLVKSLIACRDSASLTRNLIQAARRTEKEQESQTSTLFMRCLVLGAEELARGDWPQDVSKFSRELYDICGEQVEEGLKAEILLVHAISTARAGNLSEGLLWLKKAARKVGKREDTFLKDKIAAYRAILIREGGNKVSAERWLLRIYNNQVRLGAWEAAANTAVDLGMALRDNTKFRKALELYKEVSTFKVDLPGIVKARLRLQAGVIYKNLAQKRLKELQLGLREEKVVCGTEEVTRLLVEALSQNLDAMDWAESNNSMVLLIEALVERSECLLIASVLNRDTLPQAEIFLERLETMLSYIPVAARLVDFQRLRAKALALRGNLLESLECLDIGRRIALDHGLLFKACDCDYQIGFQVLYTLRMFPDSKYLAKGIESLQRAILFYRLNVSASSEYLVNVVTWKAHLETMATDLGLTVTTARSLEDADRGIL